MYLPLAAFKGYRLIQEPRAASVAPSVVLSFDGKSAHWRKLPNLLAYPGLSIEKCMWFHFLSYKLAGLMLPWIFVVLFEQLVLPMPWPLAALGGQAILFTAISTPD
jgi:hypothetical protein